MNTLTTNKIKEFVDYQKEKSYLQAEIERLENLKGLLLRRQFIDAPSDLTEVEYNKWLKKAKKTYLLSIPTQSLLMGDIHHYPNHSNEELNEDVIGNLSPNQIIQILDSLDLYTIMKLITDEVDCLTIKRHNSSDIIELIGKTEEKRLYAYPNQPFNRKLSLGHSYQERDGVKSIWGINAYEVLYRYLRLPISKVLSSINEVNTHLSCNIPFDDELCTRIEKIQSDNPIPHFERKRK